MKEKKKCGWCGQYRDVYAYQEVDWEEVKDSIARRDLLVEGRQPLRDNDVVGIPQCEECYHALRGES